jgi:membrane fusion protein, multidrug efflux system
MNQISSAPEVATPLSVSTPSPVAGRSGADATQGAPATTPKPAGKQRALPSWALVLGAGLLAAAAYIYVPGLFVVETDDAYVQADTVSIVPKVPAYVTALHVTDNSSFSAGQLLVELDPRDFQDTVNTASAGLQSARAGLAYAEAQLTEQAQLIAADEARVQGDQATLVFAQQQLVRFGELAKDGAGTMENWEEAESNIGTRQAALQSDMATLDGARAQIAVLQAQVDRASAGVAHAVAILAQATLNLSYTKIYAPVSGTVTNRTVQVGNFVQPGQTLFSAVPNEVYVVANFKETQLTQMRAGQPVSISVDAFPGPTLRGHINSFQHGTGSYFALLPPENATGNFVKVVQRVPVKILLDNADPRTHLIAPGMSVEATVTIKAPPTWLRPYVE